MLNRKYFLLVLQNTNNTTTNFKNILYFITYQMITCIYKQIKY